MTADELRSAWLARGATLVEGLPLPTDAAPFLSFEGGESLGFDGAGNVVRLDADGRVFLLDHDRDLAREDLAPSVQVFSQALLLVHDAIRDLRQSGLDARLSELLGPYRGAPLWDEALDCVHGAIEDANEPARKAAAALAADARADEHIAAAQALQDPHEGIDRYLDALDEGEPRADVLEALARLYEAVGDAPRARYYRDWAAELAR